MTTTAKPRNHASNHSQATSTPRHAHRVMSIEARLNRPRTAAEKAALRERREHKKRLEFFDSWQEYIEDANPSGEYDEANDAYERLCRSISSRGFQY